MKHRPVVDIEAVDVPPSRFDTVIEVLMIVLLVFAPLAFGAVEAWSEMVVICLAGAMVLTLALKLTFSRGARLIWSWAYVPIGLFLVLAVLQLIALPAGWVRMVSPNTATEKTRLLGDLPNAPSVLGSMTISFYSLATRQALRLALSAAAVLFVVVNVYRRPEQIKRLLGAIVIVGAAVALLALAQVISGADKIYWLVPIRHSIADGGTFVNHSNFSQFMNLSIGAALGLLLLKLYESFRGSRLTLPAVMEQLTGPEARPIWALVAFIVLGAASIFVSLSRGGAVSLLIAASFTAVLISSKRALQGRGWIMAMMALAAFVCVLYVGFDAVYDRLATLRQQHQYAGRWQIVKDISVAWTRFPAVGTGFGTHEVVYPMFDRSTIAALAGHAENEYAQTAEETGIVGLGLLVLFAIVVWRSYTRCVRRGSPAVCVVAFGLGFGLLAIMIHSFSDFGQHLPANFALTAVFCGLLVGLARIGRSAGAPTASFAVRLVGIIVLIAVAASWTWAIVGADRARAGEFHWKQALQLGANLGQNDWLGSNDDYAALLAQAEAAADAQPDSIHYRHELNVYRWRAISRVTDRQTGQVVTTPQSLKFTQRIVDELHQARLLCPTFGATYCVAGQLEMFVLDQPTGAQHIRTGYELAPCDLTACFVAGLLDAREEKIDQSLPKFRQALALNGGLFTDVVDVYLRQINEARPDLAVAVAGDNPGWLLHVARTLDEKPEFGDWAAKARAKAAAALEATCQQPDAPAWAFASLANIRRREKDYESAVDYYRQALAQDYGQVYWRLAMAQSLAETGQLPEAIHEARICLRLRPQMRAARKLIEELSVRKTQ